MADKGAQKSTRKSERLQHELLVAYKTVDGIPVGTVTMDNLVTNWAVNISATGMFINTRNPLDVGSVVRLILSLPDAPSPFDLKGKVIRSQPHDEKSKQGAGMGIEFMEVEPDKISRLERFVERLRRELPDAHEPSKKQ